MACLYLKALQMGKYRKIETNIWNDSKFFSLGFTGKLSFLYILTHPNLTMLGAMRASIDGVISEVSNNKDEKRLYKKGFKEVIKLGLIQVSEHPPCIWVPSFLRYNKPESKNVIAAWGKTVDMLPDGEIKNNVIKAVQGLKEDLPESFKKSLDKVFDKINPLDLTNTKNKEQRNKEQEDIFDIRKKLKARNKKEMKELS